MTGLYVCACVRVCMLCVHACVRVIASNDVSEDAHVITVNERKSERHQCHKIQILVC